jgi:hypothetical protein
MAVRNSGVEQESRTAIQDRTEIKEGTGNVHIRDIDMPVLVGCKRLLKAVLLPGRLWVPALKKPGGAQHPLGAGGRDRYHIAIQHQEGQPAVTLQREGLLETDNGVFFPRLQPMIPRN